MANNSRVFDPQLRDALQRAYAAAPTIEQQFPKIVEIDIELRFVRANGSLFASPHKRIYLPGMKAYFSIVCPERDCGGRFDLTQAIRAAAGKAAAGVGTLRCDGSGAKGAKACEVSLNYEILTRAGTID